MASIHLQLQAFSLVYFLLLLTSTTSSLNHDEEECLALFQFKQTILRHNYDSAAGFLIGSGSDCCLWEGVLCSSNKGHVIELDWSESSLSGIINSNSTLFKLLHLQVLDLSMNNFVESQIPSEIAHLKQLRSLNLSYSGFYGLIPNEISQLTQLISLDISGNPLKLHSSGLGYLLKNMTRLEYLDLSEVNLSSSVPRFLANFSSLRSIGLRDCQLQDEFPSAIFHLPKLKHLSLAKNLKLTGLLPEFHNNTLKPS
ncbi:putative leucine-rich repeat domain superfamily [Helianthus annuus]|nr:putative leucine-rich repeat domain superfamily [Helianthus annuus]